MSPVDLNYVLWELMYVINQQQEGKYVREITPIFPPMHNAKKEDQELQWLPAGMFGAEDGNRGGLMDSSSCFSSISSTSSGVETWDAGQIYG